MQCKVEIPKNKGVPKMTSIHYTNERSSREALISEIGYGNVIKTVVVDKGHRNGPEIHEISDTGIITVYNLYTHKMVTRLIARPGQIARYYNDGEPIPAGLMNLAREHQRLSYNYE